MTAINIPFNDWSKNKLAEGIKTATSRNKKYGEPGDTFEVVLPDGRIIKYELIAVTRKKLHEVRDKHYKDEGCSSPVEFVDVWVDIYPREGFNGAKRVWYHEFRELP